MPDYICEICQRVFKQKGHLAMHNKRKNPCKKNDIIEKIVERKMQEAMVKTNATAVIISPLPNTNAMSSELDYSKKTILELKELCKQRSIKGISGKSKSNLIAMLEQSTNITINTTETVLTEPTISSKNIYTVGDNLSLLKRVSNESIDMIYMDPPYNTGRNFYYFQDKFADFPKFMQERLVECHRILKKDGNIIIHVEPRISHHIRVICDKLFGESNFQNEIIWHSGGNAKNKYQLGRNHDTIIVYSKSAKAKFFPLYKPYTEDHKKSQKMCPIHKKLYATSAAHNSQPEVNPRPNLTYEWNGNTRQWYFSKERMKELDDDNRLEYNEKGIPRIKRFMDEMDGIPVRDTWDDISSIQNGEKTKYATQKPIKLLERIISLYSAEGDTCLDPFAGSGTLGRACKNMRRDYILFDINPEAKEVFDKGC